jgi:hypothetical protein
MKIRRSLIALVAALATATTVNAEALSTPWQVAQTEDGLYLVHDGRATPLSPVQTTRDDLAKTVTSFDEIPWLTETPVVWEGSSGKNTAPAFMFTGDYQVSWSVNNPKGKCFFVSQIKPAADVYLYINDFGHHSDTTANDSDNTYIYNLPAGMYYAYVNSSCASWRIEAQRI